MTEHDIVKALEVWTLQNLLNISIMLGMLACGLALVQGYYRAIEKHLTLRVSIEIWRALTVVLVDVLLACVVLVGYLTLNPDIMADIKMAVPFYPIAAVLFAAALVTRLFHGGHEAGSRCYFTSLWLMAAANVVNVVGFTFAAEAPGDEYKSEFWDSVREHLQSNAGDASRSLALITFYVCFPLLMCVLLWGFAAAMRQIGKTAEK